MFIINEFDITLYVIKKYVMWSMPNLNTPANLIVIDLFCFLLGDQNSWNSRASSISQSSNKTANYWWRLISQSIVTNCLFSLNISMYKNSASKRPVRGPLFFTKIDPWNLIMHPNMFNCKLHLNKKYDLKWSTT